MSVPVTKNGRGGDGVVRDVLRELRKQSRTCVEDMSTNQQDRLLGMLKRGRIDVGIYILAQVTEEPGEDGAAAAVPPRDPNDP